MEIADCILKKKAGNCQWNFHSIKLDSITVTQDGKYGEKKVYLFAIFPAILQYSFNLLV